MLLKALLCLLLLPLLFAQLCTNISMGYYTYDLSSLINITTIPEYAFNLCQSVNCLEDTGYLYTSFVTQKNTTSCRALTRK